MATKFGWPMDKEKKLKGASRRYIMTAIEASLNRVQTDWIDLYQIHLPDPLTPIEETLRAFCDKRGRTLLDLAMSWMVAHPVVSSVIAGAMKPEQLEQNVGAVAWQLSAEEMAEIDRLTRK